MKRFLQIFFIFMFAVVLIFSGYAGSTLKAEPRGTITTAVASFALSGYDQTNIEAAYYFALSDPLFTYDSKGNILPKVVRDYKISRDGLTWTFYIQKGIKFHNGDELTAEDVKFTIDRFSDPKCTNAWSRQIKENKVSMEVKDKYTLIFRSKKPEPFMIVPFQWMRVYPKKYIETVGMEEFDKKPIGSGPWKFVSKTQDKEIVYEANTEYWGKVPDFKRYVTLMVPDESTRVAMFKRGDLSLLNNVSIEVADRLKKEGYRLKPVFYPVVYNINFSGTWMTDSPIKDIRVRKAMSYALNREEMCRTYFKGYAKPAAPGFAAGENTWGWKKSWKPDPYDPGKARQLLKEAGYPEKFNNPVITIISVPSNGPQYNDHWLMCQDYWKAVGIKTEIKNIEGNAFFGLVFLRAKKPGDPSWDIVGKVWTFPFGAYYNNVYHSQNLYTSIGIHTTSNNPEIDKVYDKLLRELNPKKALKLYQEFEDMGHAQYVHFNSIMVYSQTVMGKDIGDFSDGWHLYMGDVYNYLTHP